MTIEIETAKRKETGLFLQAWLVIFLATCFGSLLAYAQIILSPVIQTNKQNETLKHVPALLSPGQATQEKQPLEPPYKIERLTIAGHKKTYIVYQALEKETIAGWVVVASGQGYAGVIELLIGLNPGVESITGLYVLDQKETPGLGNKIVESDFRSQFIDKPTDHTLIAAPKGKKASPADQNATINTIDAITGATISSKSICVIINQAVSDLREPLLKKRL